MNERLMDNATAQRLLTAAREKALPSLLGWAGVVPRTIGHTLGVGIGAFAAGMAVGAGGALLLTPTKGDELRAMMREYLQAQIDAMRGTPTSEDSDDDEAADASARSGGGKGSRARAKTKSDNGTANA